MKGGKWNKYRFNQIIWRITGCKPRGKLRKIGKGEKDTEKNEWLMNEWNTNK